MPFNEFFEKTDDIQNNAKSLLESNIAYYKLLGFKIAMKSTTLLVKFALLVLCLTFVLFFSSIACAFAIGKYLDSYALGFLIVSGFYLIGSLIIYFIKDKIVEGTILEKFSEIFFND